MVNSQSSPSPLHYEVGSAPVLPSGNLGCLIFDLPSRFISPFFFFFFFCFAIVFLAAERGDEGKVVKKDS